MSAIRLSTNRADMQLDVIHSFLATCYWSPGIPRETVARAIAGSFCIGAFDADGGQIGFARLVTDHATVGYLADVFVLDRARGQGVAHRMLRHLDAEPSLAGLRRWLLITRDAQPLYAGLGWQGIGDPARVMERVDPDPYRRKPDA